MRTADGLASASSMCERFLFTPEMQYNPVGKLSGGEKRRLCLLKVLMESPNVLILDEPTNDLDIQTLQILEDYLDRFPGVIIAVSHDRYFLDRVVTRIFAFTEDGTLMQSEGGYTDYIAHGGHVPGAQDALTGSNPANSGKAGQSGKAAQSGGAAEWKASKPKKKKLTFSQQREYDGIEAEIEALEARSKELESQMELAATDYPKLAALSQEKEEVDRQLEEKMERFIELQDLVDSFE